MHEYAPHACFTTAVADRASDLLVREARALRETVRVTRAARPFGIVAWVVLPDHMHCVWTLPERGAEYSVRWGAIEARLTRTIRDESRMGLHLADAKRLGSSVGWEQILRFIRCCEEGCVGFAASWKRPGGAFQPRTGGALHE